MPSPWERPLSTMGRCHSLDNAGVMMRSKCLAMCAMVHAIEKMHLVYSSKALVQGILQKCLFHIKKKKCMWAALFLKT